MRFSESMKILSLLGAAYLLSGIFFPTAAFLADHSRACALNYNCPSYEFEYIVTTTSAWSYFRAVAPLGIGNFIILGLINVMPLFAALFVLRVNVQFLARRIATWEWQMYRALVVGTGGVLLLEIAETALVTGSHTAAAFHVFAPFSPISLLVVIFVEALFVLNLITIRRNQPVPSLIA